MFKPKFQTTLTSNNFWPDKVVCLGAQLKLIVLSLDDVLLPHVWYGADIDALGKNIKHYNLSGSCLQKIGGDECLFGICSEIDQFISGVFLAIENTGLVERIQVYTEDKPFRIVNVEGILVEIRAFDTSFFEVFSENEQIIKCISKKFNASYLTKD